jgi:predicted XRE-type DNA-binding protein
MRCEELTDCELVLVESTERGAEVVARMRGFYESEAAHNAKPKRNAQIADFIGRGFTQAEVGAMFGISQNRVCEVMRGK